IDRGSMSESMTVRFTPNQALLNEANQQLSSQAMGMSTWMGWGIAWVLFTFPIRAIAVEPFMRTNPMSAQLAVAAVISAVVIGLLALRASRGRPNIQEQEMIFVFSNLGVEKRSLHSESKSDWNIYIKFTETDRFFFLYHSNRSADPIPKSAFPS